MNAKAIIPFANTVETRGSQQNCPSGVGVVTLDGYLRANGTAQVGHPFVNDPVVNLHTIPALAQHAGLIQRVEML